MEQTEGTILRIYLAETDRRGGRPVYEWLLSVAEQSGLSGGTVIRGMQGFGEHHHMHNAKILRLAQNLPIVVEFADTTQRIDEYLRKIESELTGALVTTHPISLRRYP